jgi:glycosyltransferase involved in cell wall biosynthesis
MASRLIVSIITPSFNREEFVAETLDSLLSQTYSDWENIIVDDGSSDRTKDIVSNYAAKDPRIKLYDRSREPKGACTCRNEGVDLCNGEFLIFLDTDDLLEPFCIEQRVKVMEENPELDFAIFPSLMFREKPNDLGLWWNIDKPIDELTRQFHQDAICQGTGVIWKKSSFNRIGRWDEGLHLWQDIDLFFRAYIQDDKYEKYFDLPPDLHNRRLETSLSRNYYFAPEKTLSRVDVIKGAVKLLKEHGKETYLNEARYMVVDIVTGAIRSNSKEIAKNMLDWAKEQGVLSFSDINRLKALVFLYSCRFTRLPLLNYLTAHLESTFHVERTLGILPHT